MSNFHWDHMRGASGDSSAPGWGCYLGHEKHRQEQERERLDLRKLVQHGLALAMRLFPVVFLVTGLLGTTTLASASERDDKEWEIKSTDPFNAERARPAVFFSFRDRWFYDTLVKTEMLEGTSATVCQPKRLENGHHEARLIERKLDVVEVLSFESDAELVKTYGTERTCDAIIFDRDFEKAVRVLTNPADSMPNSPYFRFSYSTSGGYYVVTMPELISEPTERITKLRGEVFKTCVAETRNDLEAFYRYEDCICRARMVSLTLFSKDADIDYACVNWDSLEEDVVSWCLGFMAAHELDKPVEYSRRVCRCTRRVAVETFKRDGYKYDYDRTRHDQQTLTSYAFDQCGYGSKDTDSLKATP